MVYNSTQFQYLYMVDPELENGWTLDLFSFPPPNRGWIHVPSSAYTFEEIHQHQVFTGMPHKLFSQKCSPSSQTQKLRSLRMSDVIRKTLACTHLLNRKPMLHHRKYWRLPFQNSPTHAEQHKFGDEVKVTSSTTPILLNRTGILNDYAKRYPSDSGERWRQMDVLWGRMSNLFGNLHIKLLHFKV